MKNLDFQEFFVILIDFRILRVHFSSLYRKWIFL